MEIKKMEVPKPVYDVGQLVKKYGVGKAQRIIKVYLTPIYVFEDNTEWREDEIHLARTWQK